MARGLHALPLGALLPAMLCVIAILYGQYIAAAIFAVLTCIIAVLGVVLRRL